MKFSKHLLFVLTGLLYFLSCQRELGVGESYGVLLKDDKGNCLPALVKGSFNQDSTLSDANFIDVQADVSLPGTFTIYTDTINGYYFRQTGNAERGIKTIRLLGYGKPVTAETDHFIVHYGNSTCFFENKVSGLEPAVYSLLGEPDSCKDFYADGSYLTNTNLTASNILLIKVDVKVTGTYHITATTKNNFSFSGEGIFDHTGIQTVVLKGFGKPVNEELTNVTVLSGAGKCNCGINVISDQAGKALFSFDGSPGGCSNIKFNGNYYSSIDMNVTNSLTIGVNVTKTGTYSVTTNSANGITFSSSGSFTKTGPQTIVLSASGTPQKAETTAFIPNTGTVSCNFLLDIAPLPPPATFTLSGSPGNCSPINVTGIYKSTKPLGPADYVMVEVNVTVPGSYSISTNTANGFSFSGKGVFSAAGIQKVILYSKGTPQNTQLTNFSVSTAVSTCGFTVNVL